MATNIVRKPGQQIEIVPTDPVLPLSGMTIQYGNETGIALTSAAAPGAAVTCDLGPFEADLLVTDTGGAGIAAGAILWRHPGGLLDNVPGADGVYYGRARGAVGAGLAATIRVYHDGAPGASGVIGAGTVGTAQIAANAVTTAKILNANVTAAKLSAAANSRAIIVPLGAVSATTSQVVFVAPTAGSLNAAKIVTKDAVATNDTNYWTFALTDKGATGAGTDKIVEKTTKATGGAALVAYKALDLGTLDATHKVLAAGDVVLFTATKTGSATALAEAALMLEFLPAEAA